MAGDHVAIDAGICGGCGMWAVCPSGAAQTAFPPIDASLTSLANLHRYYTDAGDGMLLVHDGQWGKEMIDMLARYGKGLPDRLIPLEVHSVGRFGHDPLAGAVTLGFARVFVLMDPRKLLNMPACISRQSWQKPCWRVRELIPKTGLYC